MQVLTLSTLPIYLPYDVAPVPFGDVVPVTVTAAAPGVVTLLDAGYVPANGDVVAFSFLAGGALPGGLSMGAIGQYAATNTAGLAQFGYFVVNATATTFQVSATKGGAGITTSSTGTNVVVHLLSGKVDGVTLPFKPGNSVVAENNTAGSLTISTAADANVAAPGQGYNPPSGPGSFTVIATIPAGAAQVVQINNDWIKASGTIILQQN